MVVEMARYLKGKPRWDRRAKCEERREEEWRDILCAEASRAHGCVLQEAHVHWMLKPSSAVRGYVL